MFQYLLELHVGYEAFRVLVWGLEALFLVLMLTPILYFLRYGWPGRRTDILDSFSESAVIYYLERFHPSGARAVIGAVKEADKKVEDATAQVEAKRAEAASKRAEAAAQEKAGNAQAVADLNNAATALEEAVIRADAATTAAKPALASARADALRYFEDYFSQEFSRTRFVLPLVLLVLLAAGLLSACSAALIYWREHGAVSDDVLPLAVVLAIFGGFTWVVFDLIDRLRSYDLTPRSLLWSSYRLMIAVPIGYAFGRVFTADLAVPMAYLLGTLPTETIMTIARRATAKWAQLTDAPPAAQSVLQVLNSVDTYTAERLAAEGITSMMELAYTDPVKISIRTGLNFSVVIGCAGEALLGIYLNTKKQLAAARKYGLAGASECGTLWEELKEGTDAEMKRAKEILTSLATDLKTTYQGVEHIVEQVACDPYTEFQMEVWADSM